MLLHILPYLLLAVLNTIEQLHHWPRTMRAGLLQHVLPVCTYMSYRKTQKAEDEQNLLKGAVLGEICELKMFWF